MYEKLAKSLREADFSDGCPCGAEHLCQLYADNNKDCVIFQAADAIEDLIAALTASNEVIAKSKPRWIPVTERLPEEYVDVLCFYEYYRYGEYNCMFRTIDRGYYGDGRWGGEAGQGRKNKVLAWMPLPEPPKEET